MSLRANSLGEVARRKADKTAAAAAAEVLVVAVPHRQARPSMHGLSRCGSLQVSLPTRRCSFTHACRVPRRRVFSPSCAPCASRRRSTLPPPDPASPTCSSSLLFAQSDKKADKIIHKSGEPLSALEMQVNSLLQDLETESPALKGLRLSSAIEVTVGPTQKACVLVAPFPQLSAWRKHFKQTQEKLEKNMPVRAGCAGRLRVARGGAKQGARAAASSASPSSPPSHSFPLHPRAQEHHVLLIAERTMQDGRVWARRVETNGVRPRSRTLKAVQEAVLDDLVYPADIAGKRTRVAAGKRVLKVILPQKEKTALTDKLDSLRAVYTKLTNKAVAFEFEA